MDTGTERPYNSPSGGSQLFRQFDRRRSVFIQLLASLFVVFFVATLATGIASYLTIRSTVVQQTYEHNLETLRQTSRIIETVLDSTDRMAVRLSQNRTVQSVVLADWTRISDHYPALRQVRAMIEDELASSPNIHSVFLVSRANDKVLSVSGILPISDFEDAPLLNRSATAGGSSRWVGPRAVRSLDGRSATVITLLVDVPVGAMENRGLLIVNVDEGLFYDTIVRRNHGDMGTLAILDQESVVLSVADKSLLVERLTIDDLYPELQGVNDGYLIVSDGSDRRFVSVITSAYNGWQYVSSRSYSRITDASRRVLFLSVVVSFIFLSVGLALSFLLSKRFYRPIESLVSLVGASSNLDSGSSRSADEFELIYSSIDTLLRENHDYQERYAAMDTILREHFLIDLVLGRTRKRPGLRSEAESFGVDLNARYYTVVVLRVVSDALGLSGNPSESRDLRYRVYGIVAGVLERHAGGFVVDFGTTDLVIAVCSDSDSPVEVCRRIAGETRDVILTDLGIGTTYGIGSAQDSYEGLPASSDQAILSLDYALSSESGSVVAMEDVVTDARLHSVVLAHRRSIEGFLHEFRQQQYDAAIRLADSFLADVISDRRLGRLHSTMLMHELLSSFLSLLLSFDLDLDAVYGAEAHLFHDFAVRKSPEEARAWMSDCVRTAIQHLAQRSAIRRRDFVGRIESYVARRYAEPIGLSDAAEYASMNRQYFCSVFKTAFGVTFGEYLAKLRIERAVELLTTTSRSIAEISTEVGYSSTKSFVRAFRTMKGLTPTKYRISLQMSAGRAE